MEKKREQNRKREEECVREKEKKERENESRKRKQQKERSKKRKKERKKEKREQKNGKGKRRKRTIKFLVLDQKRQCELKICFVSTYHLFSIYSKLHKNTHSSKELLVYKLHTTQIMIST